MTRRPTMLILSFSPIAGDARVLKQVRRFTQEFDVTTCGYGGAPEGVVEHIEVPRTERYDDLQGRLITLKLYRRAYWALSAVKWARRVLRGRRFDVILANDVEAVPLAVKLRPRCGVVADLHEYSPRLHDDHELWFKRITPWYEWVVRTYVTKAQAWTTVSNGIIEEYERNFGFRAELATNAAPFHDLEPSPTDNVIRLVHSGACLRNRHLEEMVSAVQAAEADVTLDLYLTANDPAYLDQLKAQAAAGGRVVVHDPVPYAQLIPLLNQYDVGVHLLPPVNFNNMWALPNKLFDFVQARLGVLIGPSPEMADYVRRYGIGVVADGFTADDARSVLDQLTPQKVAGLKQKSHEHAAELAGERQVEVWSRLVAQLFREEARPGS